MKKIITLLVALVAVAGIAVGSVLVLGAAGFVLFRFVLKKKVF